MVDEPVADGKPDGVRARSFVLGVLTGTVLVAGTVAAVWAIRTAPTPELTVNSSELRPDPPDADRFPADTLARLKRSTVYIERDDGLGGGGTGTGWFGGEAGLVITNAHVIGLKEPLAKDPAKLTVYVESGVKGSQRRFEGQKVKVLAVDRDMDLAVLQIVNELDLPPPLQLRPAAELRELAPLVCLGFPGGRRLADRNRSTDPPAVSVTRSLVSALRVDDAGILYSVQLQGGLVHGHSGGPVCDPAGNVVGVAVRVDTDHAGRLTTLAYAVPSEYVSGLLAGRATDVIVGQGYLRGDRVVYPIRVRCADGLRRLQGVGVGVWVGEAGRGRALAGDAHAPAGGDSGYREVALAYDPQQTVATGEIDYPKETDGRIYWVQPYYSNAVNPKRYLAGQPLPSDAPPVEHTPIELSARYPVGAQYTLRVSSEARVNERREREGHEGAGGLILIQAVTLNERVARGQPPAVQTRLEESLAPAGLKIEVYQSAEKGGWPQELVDAREALGRWAGTVEVSGDGRVADVTSAPPLNEREVSRKELANRLGHQLARTAAEAVVHLPDKRVRAGDTWTSTFTRQLKLRPEHLLADPPGACPRGGGWMTEQVTYTYLGRRDRAGRGEVVVKVDGQLRPAGAEAEPCGTVEGSVVLDETTGVVIGGTFRREFALEWEREGTKVRVSGTEEVKVTREK